MRTQTFTELGSPESVNHMEIDESNAELYFITQPVLIIIPALQTTREIDVQMDKNVSVETVSF